MRFFFFSFLINRQHNWQVSPYLFSVRALRTYISLILQSLRHPKVLKFLHRTDLKDSFNETDLSPYWHYMHAHTTPCDIRGFRHMTWHGYMPSSPTARLVSGCAWATQVRGLCPEQKQHWWKRHKHKELYGRQAQGWLCSEVRGWAHSSTWEQVKCCMAERKKAMEEERVVGVGEKLGFELPCRAETLWSIHALYWT